MAQFRHASLVREASAGHRCASVTHAARPCKLTGMCDAVGVEWPECPARVHHDRLSSHICGPGSLHLGQWTQRVVAVGMSMHTPWKWGLRRQPLPPPPSHEGVDPPMPREEAGSDQRDTSCTEFRRGTVMMLTGSTLDRDHSPMTSCANRNRVGRRHPPTLQNQLGFTLRHPMPPTDDLPQRLADHHRHTSVTNPTEVLMWRGAEMLTCRGAEVPRC